MVEYIEKPTRVGGSIADGILPGRGKIKIWLIKKDSSEDLMLTLTNIFYLPNSPSNLISFGLFNDAGIHNYNKD